MSGQVYLVTAICANRRPSLGRKETASTVASKLIEKELWGDARLLCWVLMPDHMHLLVELGQDRGLSRLVQRVKAVCALAAHRHDPGSGRFWMPGFHDRALRIEENRQAVARYILWNPVRAGLAETPREYPYWGAVWDGIENDVF